MATVKKRKLIDKCEDLLNDMVDNINTMPLDEMTKKQTVLKSATDFLTLKNKVDIEGEAGSLFKGTGDE